MGLGKRAGSARQVLNLLYRQPVISAADIEDALGVATPTANTLIRHLRELDILVELTGLRRGRIYAFQRYLKLFLS